MLKNYVVGETKEERKLRKQQEKQLKDKTVVSSVAFVLGNGVSRKNIKVVDLKPYGKIYGCNALYREFAPDYLIAVDVKMIKEITDHGYHKSNEVWTNPNKFTRDIPGLNLFQPNLGWSSGPSALYLASKHSYKEIYILGFDYEGIGRNKELVNNLYTGTLNYKKESDRATYYGNWTRQTSTCIKSNSEIKYIRVVENENSFVPDVLVGLTNLTHITVENFRKKFNLE